MADTLLDLRQQRGEIVDRMEKIANPVDDEGNAREWTDDDQRSFDEAHAEFEAIERKIQQAEAAERAAKARLVPASRPVEPTARAPKEPGTSFSRIVQALIAEKGHPRSAAAWAMEREWDDKEAVAKALGSSTATGGGFIVPPQYSAEIIDLLRDQAVVMQAGPRVMPMSGTLEIPKVTSGASGSYIGENENATKEEQEFGNVKLTAKKLASLVPISNDLIRNSSPQADIVVRDDLVQGLAVTADKAMLRGAGTEASPKGIRYWAASGNVTATNGTSADNVESDFADAHNALMSNNVPMIRPVWFMHSRSWSHLYKLRDANGNLIYPEIRDRAGPSGFGTMYGHPIYVTNHIPTNLTDDGGTDETEIYLVDMNDVIVGEETGLEIMVSSEAAYYDGSNVQAAFSRDQTVVRAIMRHDLAMRRDVSAAVIYGIDWGK